MIKERLILSKVCSIVYINTVSGGIVNFGGAIKIAPISITKSTTGSPPSTSGSTSSTLSSIGNIAGGLG